MAIFTVTTLADSHPTDTETTLREAVQQASQFSDSDLIVFDPTLVGGTIRLIGPSMQVSGTTEIRGTGTAGAAENITILPADGEGVFSISGFRPDVTISGLTIRRDTPIGATSIFINDRTTTATISNVLFDENSAEDGGALRVRGGSTVEITSCVFTSNEATGGTFSKGGANFIEQSTVSITNSTFEGNMSESVGGAIDNLEGTLLVSGSTFRGNTAEDRGGAVSDFRGTLSFAETDFFNNSATSHLSRGGAIHGNDTISLTITSETEAAFTGNTASISGGAIDTAGRIDIRNILFENNRLTNDDRATEAGALRTSSGGNIQGSTFRSNETSDHPESVGGAVSLFRGSIEVNDSNFSNNWSAGDGGAILAGQSILYATNTVFRENSAGGDGGAVYLSEQINLSRFENNTAIGNVADGSGGAFAIFDGRALLNNDEFRGNSAAATGNEGGGAIYAEASAIEGTGLVLTQNSDGDGAIGFKGAGLGEVKLDLSDAANPTQILFGSDGPDEISATSLNDQIFGRAGSDTLSGRHGSDYLDGGAGADSLLGGRGNDVYIVDNTADDISGEIGFSQGGGIDTVRAFVDYTQPRNVEILRLGNLTDTANLNGTGNDAPGTLVGNAGNNILTARGGNDRVNGNDGDDTLIGNTGRDKLSGGAGADTFVYTSISDSRAGRDNRDFIHRFDRGQDRIDFSAIDANRFMPGDQDWTFIGKRSFDGEGADSAGQLRYFTWVDRGFNVVEADLNGNGTADMQVFVNGTHWMTGTDFIL